jgi:hypothetical protein
MSNKREPGDKYWLARGGLEVDGEPAELGVDRASDDPPSLTELEHLHHSLSGPEREELLECLLIAASRGASSMMRALTPWIVIAAGRELLDDLEG